MKLYSIFDPNQKTPAHFDGAYKIPWNEPEFSKRMLKEHLNQDHEWASRPFVKIDQHVAWIHTELLGGKSSRILDLGCGPGFYASRLAALGHTIHGIDFSPASIEYANQHNDHPDRCEYVLGDIREIEYGEGYDFAFLVYGEFNAFPKSEAAQILVKAQAALHPGGQLLVEPNYYEAVKRFGAAPNSWYHSESGLFSDKPHVCLVSNDWDETTRSAQSRFIVIDNATGDADQYFSTTQACTDDDYRAMLEEVGFTDIKLLPGFGQTEFDDSNDLMLIRARKA